MTTDLTGPAWLICETCGQRVRNALPTRAAHAQRHPGPGAVIYRS